MERTQIQFEEEQLAALRRTARQRGMSVAGVVREAVEAHLAKESTSRQWEHARHSLGGFHSGRSDISERHDDYLADDFA